MTLDVVVARGGTSVSDPAPMTIGKLVTIPLSHYCEKARWGLDPAGTPYREEAHAPGLHMRASFGAGGRRTVPVFVTSEGRVLDDSTAIVEHADAVSPREARLFPEDPAERREVVALENMLDEQLG